MITTAKPKAQLKPVANTMTKLFTVGANTNLQGSLSVNNQVDAIDKVSIAIVPGGGNPVEVNILPKLLQLPGWSVYERHLRLNAGDEVWVLSLNGTSVFHCDILEAANA